LTHDRLDDQRHIGGLGQRGDRRDARQRRLCRVGGELALAHQSVKGGGQLALGLRRRAFARVVEHHALTAWAATCAMPAPMTPAPITRTVRRCNSVLFALGRVRSNDESVEGFPPSWSSRASLELGIKMHRSGLMKGHHNS
jgi:hypothetical protein